MGRGASPLPGPQGDSCVNMFPLVDGQGVTARRGVWAWARDDEQGDGELRGDDAKGGVTPPSRFLLSLSKHLIHCHLQTEKKTQL